ncbi:MAG: tetratricopeptide repeat protein [Deltaproteobacteria bacterium]|nr:tetratricopeptide repeat protein [Deltaproteobacteria bacterium]
MSRDEGEQMMDEINRLKTEVKNLREKQALDQQSTEERLQNYDKEAQKLSQSLENIRSTYGSNVADFGVQLDKVVSSIMELNGKYELNVHRIDELNSELNKLKEAYSRLPQQSIQKSAEKQEEKSDKLSGIKRPATRKEYIALAKKFLAEKQWEASRIILEEALSKWNDQGKYEIIMLTAESYYREGKFQNAILEYEKIIKDNPKNFSDMDEVFYKMGISFINISLRDDGRTILEELVKNYPKSRYTPMAQKKLKEIKK